jgi:hypothetical protein
MAKGSTRASQPTEFLNVDIDLNSMADPEPLVRGLGSRVLPDQLGKVGRAYWVRFMLARQPLSPEEVILGFAKLVDKLPASAKRIWKNATHKEFDIGIQSGFQPKPAEWVLEPKVIETLARLGAQIRITVYSPEAEIRTTPRASSAGSTRRK